MYNGSRDRVLRIILLILVFFAGACSVDDDMFTGKKEEIPDQTINGFTVVESKSGLKQWELVAEKADIYQKKNNTLLYKPRVKFYDSEEIVTATLTADEGTVNTKTNDVFMRGNVIVVSDDENTVVTTETLMWDSKREKILSDDFVRQENEEVIITGYGLEADSKLGSVIIKRKVRVEQKAVSE